MAMLRPSETTWPIKAKRGTKVYINDPGHMTKLSAMAINSKTFKIFFSRTRRLMILKLDIKHQEEELYKI